MKTEHLNQLKALLKVAGPRDIRVAVSSDSVGDVCDCLENKAQGNDVIASELDVTSAWADLIALLLNNADSLAESASSYESYRQHIFDTVIGPTILSSLTDENELLVRRIWDKARRACLMNKPVEE